MKEIKFTIPGPPKGKARPRVTKHGAYTPKETVMYENLVKICCKQKMKEMLEGPIGAVIVAYFPIPKSTSKKKAEEMRTGSIFPTKKPDMDNIVKAVLDSLNGIAYHDDSQVTSLTVHKMYLDEPRVDVFLTEIEEDED